MIFGILKDKKAGEYRVICTPREVKEIVRSGHRVLFEKGCGLGAGFSDEEYILAGGERKESAEEIFNTSELVAKVKEIDPSEYKLLRRGQIIYCCMHPAANPQEVDAILESRCCAITAEDSHRYGSVNCEAAGKQGALFGLESMLTINGGKGVFVGGFVGAPKMRVLILGAGEVGRGAISVLSALGAEVTVMDINEGALKNIVNIYGTKVTTLLSSKEAIRALLPRTDMLINCVKWQKERRDFLVDREMLRLMEKGSVLVDISNDVGGAIETCREMSHDNPRYTEEGVVHYSVSNIPSAVARSTSIALGAQTLPIILKILTFGVRGAAIKDGYIRRAITAIDGKLTHRETADVQNRERITPEVALGIESEPLDHVVKAF